MTDTIKISQLGEDTTPSTADFLPLVDESTVTTKRVSVANLINLIATGSDGWTSLPYTVNTVTPNGNRSYNLLFNSADLTSIISPGMRLKTTRTSSAPTESASLNGTSQYFNRSSTITGMTWTDDFVAGAWIKLASYPGGTNNGVMGSRYNGTSGWEFSLDPVGRVVMAGYNASGSNVSYVISAQSVSLNRWVWVCAQLDMSSFSVSSTTSYTMINGLDVPASVTRSGSSPTSLIQAGNLEIGSRNSGTNFFPGKIAQIAFFSAKVTQSTMRGYMSQSYIGTEISLASAYTLSNSLTDLNTTSANNITPQSSATTTNADSPFGGQAGGLISSVLDYGLIQSCTVSGGNTTIVCQVAEGCTFPTTGSISSIGYSPVKTPYGFPAQKSKWTIETLMKLLATQSSPTTNTWYNLNFVQLSIPIGEWNVSYFQTVQVNATGGDSTIQSTVSTANNSDSDNTFNAQAEASSTGVFSSPMSRNGDVSLASQTLYYLNSRTTSNGGSPSLFSRGDTSAGKLTALNGLL